MRAMGERLMSRPRTLQGVLLQVEEACLSMKRQLKCKSDAGTVASLRELLHPFGKKTASSATKVAVVGCGQVGVACIVSMFTQVSNNVVFVDNQKDKLKGEMMDLQHGSAFLEHVRVNASTDYSITKGAKICIVAAGVRQRKDETRLDLVQRNTGIMKEIIPQLLKYCPDALFIIASNPVDVLTYVTWKISGLPKHRVIGSGTNLDSARFRFLLSEICNVSTTSCHAYIIGEHGDSSVPVWSGVNIGGVRLSELNPKIGADDDPENWNDVHKQVVQSAYEVVHLKGFTSWAIGLSLSQLTRSILTNANSIHPVTCCVKGLHGIEEDVFLSLPCVLGAEGIVEIIKQQLTQTEREKLRKSAAMLAKVQDSVKL